LYVLAVGSRSFDVSPYGAMDMLLNAAELYQTIPGRPSFGQMRYFSIEWSLGLDSGAKYGFQYPKAIAYPAPMSLSRLFSINSHHPDYQALPRFDAITYVIHNLIENAQLTGPYSVWHLVSKSTVTCELPGYIQELAIKSFYLKPLDFTESKKYYNPGYRRNTVYVPQSDPSDLVGGYGLWASPPPHFHQEMGRKVPGFADAINLCAQEYVKLPFHVSLYRYCSPIGFRCAR